MDEERLCLFCKKTFRAIKKTRKFCTQKCYWESRSFLYSGENHNRYRDGSSFSGGICNFCNKKYSGRKRIYCSNKCQTRTLDTKGNKNGHWKGGRFISGGYVYILNQRHPQATKMGYVLEHRLVMEKHIGRYLFENEIVHHKNHRKNDNRISNLVLMTKIEHDRMHLAEYRDTKRNRPDKP